MPINPPMALTDAASMVSAPPGPLPPGKIRDPILPVPETVTRAACTDTAPLPPAPLALDARFPPFTSTVCAEIATGPAAALPEANEPT